MEANDKILYTVKETAGTLGVNVHVIYNLINFKGIQICLAKLQKRTE